MAKGAVTFVLIAVILFFLFFFLLKSFIKAAIFITIFIVVFRIGWIYSSDDLKEKLHLDSFISEKYQSNIFNSYDNYKERREKEEVINPNKIDDAIIKQLNDLDRKVDEFIKENN